MIIGYARVSTDGQTLDAQQAALLFSEKVSGAKTDRAQLARALATLPSGRHPGGVQARQTSALHQGPT
jgi:DNA invertase Pin-like site-specific DNA recombinase